MAAIICQGIANLFKGCSEVACVPCQFCCKGLGQACSATCSGLGQIICSPFSPYLLVTVFLNVPPAMWGLKSLVATCEGANWLWINAPLAIVHILASFYIATKIQQTQHEFQATEATPNINYATATTPAVSGVEAKKSGVEAKVNAVEAKAEAKLVDAEKGQPTAIATPYQPMSNTGGYQSTMPYNQASRYQSSGPPMKRITKVLCYDFGVAIYIVLASIWLFWQAAGLTDLLSNADVDNQGACHSVQQWKIFSIVCGFMYTMLVCVAFACSLICLR